MKRFKVINTITSGTRGFGVKFEDGSSAYNKGDGEVKTLGPLATKVFFEEVSNWGLRVDWVDE